MSLPRHPWLTTSNLPYTFFLTSPTALCGTIGTVWDDDDRQIPSLAYEVLSHWKFRPSARPEAVGSITMFWLNVGPLGGLFLTKKWSRCKRWQQPADSMLRTDDWNSICVRTAVTYSVFSFHQKFTKMVSQVFSAILPETQWNLNSCMKLLS